MGWLLSATMGYYDLLVVYAFAGTAWGGPAPGCVQHKPLLYKEGQRPEFSIDWRFFLKILCVSRWRVARRGAEPTRETSRLLTYTWRRELKSDHVFSDFFERCRKRLGDKGINFAICGGWSAFCGSAFRNRCRTTIPNCFKRITRIFTNLRKILFG